MAAVFHRLLGRGWPIRQLLWRTIFFLRRMSVGFVVFSVRFLRLLLVQELILRLYLGRGERPGRILFVAIVILVGTTIGYWLGGSFVLDPQLKPPPIGHPSFGDAAYYSLVSFVALGYGRWAIEPVGWAPWIGAIESFLGIFSVVFFTITFAQRITR